MLGLGHSTTRRKNPSGPGGGVKWPGGYAPLAFTGGTFPSYPRTIVVDPTNHTLTFAGSFANVNGVAKVNRAKVLADGTVDNTWIPPVIVGADSYHDGFQDAGGGKVWAPGRYSLVDGAYQPLFRMNADGSRDVSFNHAAVTGTAGNISRWICPLPDGGVMVCSSGVATPPYTIGGQPSEWARLNADGTMSENQPPPHRQGANGFGMCKTMATCDDGRVVFVFLGNTISIGATTTGNVVCLNANYTLNDDSPIALSVGDGYNYALGVLRHGEHLYFYGAFTTFNGHTTHGVARTDQNFVVDTSFVAPAAVADTSLIPDNSVYVEHMKVDPFGRLLVGYGDYSYLPFTVGGLPCRCGLMALDANTGDINTTFHSNLSTNPDYIGLYNIEVLRSGFIYATIWKPDYSITLLTIAPDGTLVSP